MPETVGGVGLGLLLAGQSAGCVTRPARPPPAQIGPNQHPECTSRVVVPLLASRGYDAIQVTALK